MQELEDWDARHADLKDTIIPNDEEENLSILRFMNQGC
jgi:hypothetical protein